MVDWTVVASLATAAGTLALAAATLVAVRSANRSARLAEYSMQIGIRPLLMPSRLEDATQKIMWGDGHWAALQGGGSVVEIVDGNIYLAMSLHNSGSGIAVIQGWHVVADLRDPHSHAEPGEFRQQLRDLYIAGNDIGFWQAAIRDREDPEYESILEAARTSRIFGMELLYSDHEGGQRAIGRFALAPIADSRWLSSVVRHSNLDRPNPRDR